MSMRVHLSSSFLLGGEFVGRTSLRGRLRETFYVRFSPRAGHVITPECLFLPLPELIANKVAVSVQPQREPHQRRLE